MRTRRVFLIGSKNLGIFAFFVPGNNIFPMSTHAVSEVKTLKGWPGVDSTSKFIATDNNLNPYTFKNVSKASIKLPNDIIFDNKFYSIIGLYSRKGNYYKPYFPFLPEINLNDFLLNF